MNKQFKDLNLDRWAVEDLNNRGYYQLNQLTYMSEEEIMSSHILPIGTLKHLSIALEEEGIYFRNGQTALNRLHLRKGWIKLFLRNDIYDLTDMSEHSWSELAYEIGCGRQMACYIESRMRYLGLSLS